MRQDLCAARRRSRGYRHQIALRPEHVAEAQAAQTAAAHDEELHVRVVAGPGTGKSATVEQRVCWLLDRGVASDAIAAVSFTRAAANDLAKRIKAAIRARGLGESIEIRATTLHGLALRTLRRAGALDAYPVDPTVLQQWELVEIFDAEFGAATGNGRKVRRAEIRRDHEAFWSTGEFTPPTTIPPDPPISGAERDRFRLFHGPRTQLYACVLPGEIVARCVERMDAGTLNPAELLGIGHLIVDEFQDLNPMDLRFVHGLAERGVSLFTAGDDDQSLYAFRHASPHGIQQFPEERGGCGDHTLHHCFRCAPRVLAAAQTLMRSYGAEGRIEKQLVSLWDAAEPRVRGGLGCWEFETSEAEAEAVAASCTRLIEAGLRPSE